jgi:hypothetical protein
VKSDSQNEADREAIREHAILELLIIIPPQKRPPSNRNLRSKAMLQARKPPGGLGRRFRKGRYFSLSE